MINKLTFLLYVGDAKIRHLNEKKNTPSTYEKTLKYYF